MRILTVVHWDKLQNVPQEWSEELNSVCYTNALIKDIKQERQECIKLIKRDKRKDIYNVKKDF